MAITLRYLSLFALITQMGWADFLYHTSAMTDGGEFNASYAIENLNNGGFYSANEMESAAADATGRSYASKTPPTGGYPVTITLEFDALVSLNAFHLWNHSNNSGSGATAQGVNAFTLIFYDGPGGTGSQIGSPFSSNAAKAPASGTYAAETFDFGTTYEDVRSVVLTANNHNPNSNFVGIREIAFNGTINFLYHANASANGGEFNPSFSVGNLKNGGYSSPFATEDASASPGTRSYATANPPINGYPVTITLEFNSAASLQAFYLWNHSASGANGSINQGVDAFTLTFYDSPEGTGNPIGLPFSANAAKAPATGNYGAEIFNFGTTYENVRSVVLTADNHQPSSGFVGIREIGFKGSVAPIPAATPDKVIVYLVGGQSNADGYGVSSQLASKLQAPQLDIDLYHANAGGNSPLPAKQWIRLQPGSGSNPGNAGGFGPELNFGIAIHDALGSERARIAIIKHTLGGSSLHTDWFPGGDGTPTGDGPVYQMFQTTVTNALAALATLYPDATIQIEGMIWHQGESDTGSAALANAYQVNLANFIADLRATANIGSSLKFGIVQLSDHQTAINANRLTTVQLAQATVAAADPLNYLVTTDDLPVVAGDIHFGTNSVLSIGSRLATDMQQTPITDHDGNGLDDDWEELHWGLGNMGQDPDGDEDKDLFTNLTEFLWLTDPHVHNTISPDFQILPEPTITWPSSPNRRYLVEVSTNLEEWERLDSFVPGSTGNTTTLVLPVDSIAPHRFFRIGVQR